MARPMMFALASDSPQDERALREVAEAVQAQITDDVEPLWRVSAEVRAYRTIDEGLDEMRGACPVLVSRRFRFPAQGVHQDYHDKQPFALIRDDGNANRRSSAISHEIIEILVDPTGRRTVAGPSIMPGQGPVEYLVEVCDPPEDEGYEIGDVLVSDFCTPRYYDAYAPPGSRFDRMGKIDAPLGVLNKGYLSWRDAKSGKWWQRRRFAGDDGFVDLGVMDAGDGSLRARIDHAVRVNAPLEDAVRDRTIDDKLERIRWMADNMRPGDDYPPSR